MAATGHAVPLGYCDEAECVSDPMPYYEFVTFDGAEFCPPCAFEAAAQVVSPLLRPHWTPTSTTLRSAEDGVRVLEQLLARAKALIAVERTKEVR